MAYDFFPMFININNKKCLIVGAGNIAYRKAKTLLEYGAKVEIITKELINEKISKLDVDIKLGAYQDGDVDDYFLVVAATDNADLNKEIYLEADSKGILVNNITTKTDLNTRFSAVMERDDFTIAVSSKGKSPKQSVEIRNRLEEIL